MPRRGAKQFGTEMPDVLFVIDNDYEQRYYRSPEAMGKGVCGWLDDKNGRIHAYRLITDDAEPLLREALAERDRRVANEEAEFNKIVGPQGFQPQAPNGVANWDAWNKLETALHKVKVKAVADVLRRIR